jgi:hypothetical protein
MAAVSPVAQTSLASGIRIMQLLSVLSRVVDYVSADSVQDTMAVVTAALSFRRDQSFVEITLAIESCGASAPRAEANAALLKWEFLLSCFQEADGFVLPATLGAALIEGLSTFDLAGVATPIWLRLARPYGLLGIMPWESALGLALNRPVLRLPDFPGRVAERADVLENVIIVDPPNDDRHTAEVQRRLSTLLKAILAGSSRSDTRVHVFINAAWFPRLRIDHADNRVRFADPLDHARRDGRRDAGGIEQWTDWILATVAGRGIDAVHLIGRAALSEAEGSCLLSGTPFVSQGLVPEIEMGVEEVSQLLNQAGAWSVTFTPAISDYRPSVAFIADALAHRWPGAVLFLGLEGDTDVTAMKTAARLLFAVEATAAPRLVDGFMYCHPAFLKGKQAKPLKELMPLLAAHAVVLTARAPAVQRAWGAVTRALPGITQAQQSTPPAWLGATQRFLESEVFSEIRRTAPDVLMSRRPEQQWGADHPVELNSTTKEVLSQLHSVVVQYLADQREGKKDVPNSNS